MNSYKLISNVLFESNVEERGRAFWDFEFMDSDWLPKGGYKA